jgi:hypothetical protein
MLELLFQGLQAFYRPFPGPAFLRNIQRAWIREYA